MLNSEVMDQAKRTFYALLANTLIASVTNSFVWFALTFWVFLNTGSVLATSYVAGSFAVANMVSALYFGGIVDHNKKKTAMLYSNYASLVFFTLGGLLYFIVGADGFADTSSLQLWGLIALLILGSVAGNLRMIALTTTVSLLFTENKDKMNGLVGTVNGVSFATTSILSGLAIGFSDMGTSLVIAVVASFISLVHLLTITLKEELAVPTESATPKSMDLRGTYGAVQAVPGLFALIFFTTFNNFLGGVFMALMDAYGLSLMSVEAWGILLALLSFGFILGGMYIAKFGLSKNPLRRLLLVNVINWTVCIFFVIQPSIILLALGMLVWMTLFPFIEATEHTVIQKVVPYERQGRVLGFAQSIESAASPITAFLIGPIAQFFFIPLMTTGAGALLIGQWFGTGADRGIALVFICAGFIGLIVTLLAFRSNAYRLLSKQFTESEPLPT